MNLLKCFLPCLLLIDACWANEDQAVCHDSAAYRIAEGPTGEVGTHFLIKYKSSQDSAPRCEYLIEPGDFEIRNEDAEYFLALRGDLLILDSGTGPDPRGLVIWHLKRREKVYSGTYSDATVAAESMEFWQESGAATDANCPQASEWRASGLGAAIETKVRLSFADLLVKPTTHTRCSARQ